VHGRRRAVRVPPSGGCSPELQRARLRRRAPTRWRFRSRPSAPPECYGTSRRGGRSHIRRTGLPNVGAGSTPRSGCQGGSGFHPAIGAPTWERVPPRDRGANVGAGSTPRSGCQGGSGFHPAIGVPRWERVPPRDRTWRCGGRSHTERDAGPGAGGLAHGPGRGGTGLPAAPLRAHAATVLARPAARAPLRRARHGLCDQAGRLLERAAEPQSNEPDAGRIRDYWQLLAKYLNALGAGRVPREPGQWGRICSGRAVCPVFGA